MPSLSESLKQIEDELDDVLRSISNDYARPHCALFETERKDFVVEESSLRERVKEINSSASTSSIFSLRRLIGLPPLQAQQCLEEAGRLRMRVEDKMNERRRSTLTGRSSPFGSSMSARSMDGRFPVDDTSEPANETAAASFNMQHSVSDIPKLHVDPPVESGSDFEISVNEAMSTPIRPTSDRMSDLYHDAQSERTYPSSPTRRAGRSSVSETPQSPRRSDSFKGFPRPSPQSVGQSRTRSARSSGLAFLDPAMIPSIASLAWDAHNQQERSMTNCMSFSNSHVIGATLNNGGKNNSGAVIHMM